MVDNNNKIMSFLLGQQCRLALGNHVAVCAFNRKHVPWVSLAEGQGVLSERGWFYFSHGEAVNRQSADQKQYQDKG